MIQRIEGCSRQAWDMELDIIVMDMVHIILHMDIHLKDTRLLADIRLQVTLIPGILTMEELTLLQLVILTVLHTMQAMVADS